MSRALLAIAIAVVVAAVSIQVRRRRVADPPSQPRWQAPVQLDRNDFDRPDAPWLVALFTSATCESCAALRDRAAVLDSRDVVVAEAEVGARRDVHRRYAIEAVPIVCIADHDGVVVRSFIGPVTATDLWAAVAAARDPGSSPGPCADVT